MHRLITPDRHCQTLEKASVSEVDTQHYIYIFCLHWKTKVNVYIYIGHFNNQIAYYLKFAWLCLLVRIESFEIFIIDYHFFIIFLGMSLDTFAFTRVLSLSLSYHKGVYIKVTSAFLAFIYCSIYLSKCCIPGDKLILQLDSKSNFQSLSPQAMRRGRHRGANP